AMGVHRIIWNPKAADVVGLYPVRGLVRAENKNAAWRRRSRSGIVRGARQALTRLVARRSFVGCSAILCSAHIGFQATEYEVKAYDVAGCCPGSVHQVEGLRGTSAICSVDRRSVGMLTPSTTSDISSMRSRPVLSFLYTSKGAGARLRRNARMRGPVSSA